jgi:signal transduction histidine kinase
MTPRILSLRSYYKVWTASVVACLATLVLAAFRLPKSFGLMALSDVVQCLLLLSGTLSFTHHIVRTEGRERLFWILLTTGIGLWFCYQVFWVYFEVLLRSEVPDLFSGDMILFLHIVPLMAAVALRPHANQDEYAARLRLLDFALLVVWWVYLYVFAVTPWQYVVPDARPYNRDLNSLYLLEKIALLAMILVAWAASKGGWRIFYANLFGASLTYAGSSYLATWALGRHTYYSGSLYDIPLAISMAWISVIGLWTRERNSQTNSRPSSVHDGVWLARLGMIAAFSLPLFGAWALSEHAVPASIRSFRVALTLAVAILMGIMVFARQRLLDRELLRLLSRSQQSFTNLKRLQAQITESEKLASIGQLVAGAAHELNNPIAAMLGYSDLLVLSKPLNAEQNELTAKIGQHARRTKSLVASLLSFAKPSPSALAPVDLKTLLRTAVKLSQSQWQSRPAEIRTEFLEEPLVVRGDSNQLLQVCTQIINDALRAIDRRNSRNLIISTQSKDAVAVIQIADTEAPPANEKLSNGILSSLGLSACEVILRQHHGTISQKQSKSGFLLTIELPLISSVPEKSNQPDLPGSLQAQPFS